MGQKLSAMTYIKNNKRRVSVLVISMAMCLVLFYLTQFLLSVSTETFRVILQDQREKVQYVWLPSYAFKEDVSQMSDNEYWLWRYQAHEELSEEMKKIEGVENVYFVNTFSIKVSAVIGQYYIEAPLLPQSELENYMAHWDVNLIEGEMPKKTNEILLSVNMMKNGSFQIGDVIEGLSDYTIVGVVDGDDYFACGLDNSGVYENPAVCVLTDKRIENMSQELYKLGYSFEEADAYIADIRSGAKSLEADVTEPIEFSSRLIYVAIVCVLSFLVLIVYISYLRDRRNEWCLYSSIGFSRKSIYASVVRELLFTFGLAFVGAYSLIAVLVVVLDHTLIYEMGLRCRYLYLDVVVENLCLYVILFGILQIPIRYALYKIRTIDAMDDELNA